MALDLVVQYPAGYSKEACSVFLDPVAHVKRLQYEALFNFFKMDSPGGDLYHGVVPFERSGFYRELQVFRFDNVVVCHEHGPFDCVLELAYVARPGVFRERFYGKRVDLFYLFFHVP